MTLCVLLANGTVAQKVDLLLWMCEQKHDEKKSQLVLILKHACEKFPSSCPWTAVAKCCFSALLMDIFAFFMFPAAVVCSLVKAGSFCTTSIALSVQSRWRGLFPTFSSTTSIKRKCLYRGVNGKPREQSNRHTNPCVKVCQCCFSASSSSLFCNALELTI